MKSIQIMLLICTHLGETFPVMEKDAIQTNLNALIQKDLIGQDFTDYNVKGVHDYVVTEKGRVLIHALYDTFVDIT